MAWQQLTGVKKKQQQTGGFSVRPSVRPLFRDNFGGKNRSSRSVGPSLQTRLRRGRGRRRGTGGGRARARWKAGRVVGLGGHPSHLLLYARREEPRRQPVRGGIVQSFNKVCVSSCICMMLWLNSDLCLLLDISHLESLVLPILSRVFVPYFHIEIPNVHPLSFPAVRTRKRRVIQACNGTLEIIAHNS